jgi:hypothetical protein
MEKQASELRIQAAIEVSESRIERTFALDTQGLAGRLRFF